MKALDLVKAKYECFDDLGSNLQQKKYEQENACVFQRAKRQAERLYVINGGEWARKTGRVPCETEAINIQSRL